MKSIDTRTQNARFKELLKPTSGCRIEIRCPRGNSSGRRLQKSLSLAGAKTDLIEAFVAPPSAGILIEASPDCAQVALSIQTAFKAIDMEAHLLIQSTPEADVVIIHLNSEEKMAPE